MNIRFGIMSLAAGGLLATTPVFAQDTSSSAAESSAPMSQSGESEQASVPMTGGMTDRASMASEEQTSSSDPSGSAQSGGQQSGSQQSPIASSLIEEMQQALKDQGQDVQVDGMWGQETASALRQFQQEQNLEASGQIDMATIEALNLQEQQTASAEGQQQQQ